MADVSSIRVELLIDELIVPCLCLVVPRFSQLLLDVVNRVLADVSVDVHDANSSVRCPRGLREQNRCICERVSLLWWCLIAVYPWGQLKVKNPQAQDVLQLLVWLFSPRLPCLGVSAPNRRTFSFVVAALALVLFRLPIKVLSRLGPAQSPTRTW